MLMFHLQPDFKFLTGRWYDLYMSVITYRDYTLAASYLFSTDSLPVEQDLEETRNFQRINKKLFLKNGD